MTATLSQPQRALSEANRVKTLRTELRIRIVSLPQLEGCRLLAEHIENPPEWFEGADVLRVLSWPHRMGSSGAERMFASLGLRQSHRVGELTPRLRGVLAERLRLFGERRTKRGV